MKFAHKQRITHETNIMLTTSIQHHDSAKYSTGSGPTHIMRLGFKNFNSGNAKSLKQSQKIQPQKTKTQNCTRNYVPRAPRFKFQDAETHHQNLIELALRTSSEIGLSPIF